MNAALKDIHPIVVMAALIGVAALVRFLFNTLSSVIDRLQ